MSMTRTCVKDEDGAPISGGPSDLRFWLHELLDDCVFYPIQNWLRHWVGDNKVYNILRTILGFAWGFNCGFPARDVVLHTAWYLRGCPARWVKIAPNVPDPEF